MRLNHLVPLTALCVIYMLASGGQALSASALRSSPPSAEEIERAIKSLPEPEQAAVKTARDKVIPVFVFIPGILGSKLTRTENGLSRIIWGEIGWKDLIKDNPAIAYSENDGVSAEVLDTFYALSKEMDVYGRAYQKMKLITGTPDYVMRFPYDWRQSNTKSAADLTNWLCDTKRNQKLRDNPVVFVAHSMGGLVLKYWLKHLYKEHRCANDPSTFAEWLKVRKIIFLGTPNFGAPKAILAFSKGFSLYVDVENDEIWAQLFGKIDSRTLARNLNKYGIYFPSSYELLPIVNTTKGCFEHPEWPNSVRLQLSDGSDGRMDLFDPEIWRELGWPVQLSGKDRDIFISEKLPLLLRSAKDFLCDIAAYDVDAEFDVVRIFGFKISTVCTINIQEPKRTGDSFEVTAVPCPGDGTVPKWIAADERHKVIRWPDEEVHIKLVSDQSFFVYLDQFYSDLLSELVKTAAVENKGNRGPIAAVLSEMKYLPPSPSAIAGEDPIISAVGRDVVQQLKFPSEEIYRNARTPSSVSSVEANRRAAAYRVFADVSEGNDRSRAWALNNAADIYLKKKHFLQASNLGKRAIQIADHIKDAKYQEELKDLRSKAAWTVAIASQQLGNETDAQRFQALAIKNGNKKAKRIQLSRHHSKGRSSNV
jgi:hypothetical protein